jgi:hypothetical protein
MVVRQHRESVAGNRHISGRLPFSLPKAALSRSSCSLNGCPTRNDAVPRGGFATQKPQTLDFRISRTFYVSFILSTHRQNCWGRCLGFVLPKHGDDAKRFLLLNQTGQVVAEDFAEHFIDHRRIGPAHNGIAKLSLDR